MPLGCFHSLSLPAAKACFKNICHATSLCERVGVQDGRTIRRRCLLCCCSFYCLIKAAPRSELHPHEQSYITGTRISTGKSRFYASFFLSFPFFRRVLPIIERGTDYCRPFPSLSPAREGDGRSWLLCMQKPTDESFEQGRKRLYKRNML